MTAEKKPKLTSFALKEDSGQRIWILKLLFQTKVNQKRNKAGIMVAVVSRRRRR